MIYDEAIEFFAYDSIAGILYWKKMPPYNKRSVVGSEAGKEDSSGYKKLKFKYKRYFVHRIIMLIYNRKMPNKVDHINGIRTDNRIINLRDVTVRINSQNRFEHRGGKLVGTYYIKKLKKWKSQIVHNKKLIYLGLFKTELEAHEAYLNKEKDILINEI